MPTRWGGPNEKVVRDQLYKVLNWANGKGTEYAKTYAAAGLEMTDEDLRVQVLYVLSNLQYWRGPIAREVKQALKNEYAQSSNPI